MLKVNSAPVNPTSIAVLNVFVCPEVSGNVTVVTVGAAITPSHVLSALVITVEAGIATFTLLALVEVILIAGSVPVPPVINELTSIVGFVVPLLIIISTDWVGFVITTSGVVELIVTSPLPSFAVTGAIWVPANIFTVTV